MMPDADHNEPFATLDRTVRHRRAIRGFQPTPLDRDIIRQALAVASGAPSNCNVQPWIIHLVQGDTLDRLRAALIETVTAGTAPDDDFGSTKAYPGVYRTRQIETAQLLYGAIGVERHDKAGRAAASLRNFAMFDAPHVALLFVPDWAGPRELADAGAWAQTFMLALTALGIGSIPQAALGLYPGVTRAILDIPETQRLLYGISFGLADTAAPANSFEVGRATLDEIVTVHD
jgi:nitroreductase